MLIGMQGRRSGMSGRPLGHLIVRVEEGHDGRVPLLDRVIDELRANPKGLTDAELARRTSSTQQQVARGVRHLSEIGAVSRVKVGRTVRNRLVDESRLMGNVTDTESRDPSGPRSANPDRV